MLLDYLRCRTYGHSWDEWRPANATRPADLTLRCTRCSTERYDQIDDLGAVERRSYVYPNGYRIESPPDRSELRLELLTRLRAGRRRRDR